MDVQINESDLEEQLHDTRRDGIEEKRTSPVQVQDKPEENIATHEAYCSVNIQAASSCSNPRTPQLKLPLVKPRGRPRCKSVQKGKRQREPSDVAITPFVQMTEMAKHKCEYSV